MDIRPAVYCGNDATYMGLLRAPHFLSPHLPDGLAVCVEKHFVSCLSFPVSILTLKSLTQKCQEGTHGP